MFKRGFTKLNIIGMIVGIVLGLIFYPPHRNMSSAPPTRVNR